MGRMTRKKAAEVAEQLHIDESELLDLPSSELALAAAAAKGATPEPTDRPPLGEIAPNSASSKDLSDDGAQELRKSTRNKRGGKKGAVSSKSKTTNFAGSTATLPDPLNDNTANDVLPDENDSPPSPASENAAQDLMRNVPKLVVRDDTSSPPTSATAAVKLTRSQLRKQQTETVAEPKSLLDGLGQGIDERGDMKEETLQDTVPAIETDTIMEDGIKDAQFDVLDAPASPLPSAVPNVVSHLRLDTPAKRSTSNKENVEPDSMPSNYDLLEEAVVGSATPPAHRATADPIEALDQLDEAVENVNRDIPNVQASPAKPRVAKETTPPKKKAAPVVRTTKAAAARISMAHNKEANAKPPALGRPRQSMTLGRASSVRESSVRSVSGGKRVTSISSAKDEPTELEKKEVVIPHSKPRPISMSFPTPPPPPKSTKAPTQSTFQLPGEAIAAKLKAAREARQVKELEEAKRPGFKARPVPATMKGPPPAVRQTNASKARESIMNGRDFSGSSSTGARTAHGRANSVATTHPSITKPRVPSTSRGPPAAKPSTFSASVRPRPSTAMANMSKPRASLSTSGPAPASGQRVPSSGTSSTAKGKEVFNRAANAKAAADQQKADREAAAKKARAEAAERSRQLSREFAEKQKAKKALAAAAAAKGVEAGA